MRGAEQDPLPNAAIRKYIQSPDGPTDWQHRERASWLYDMSRIIGNVFYAPRDEAQSPMPDIVIGIDHLRVDTYAAYHLVPNALGIKYQITFNDHHINRSEWSLLETLTHEMGHVVQEEIFQNGGKPPYHNKGFVEMMEQLGIHAQQGEGYHTRPADLQGQFGRLMAYLGVQPPKVSPSASGGEKRGTKVSWWDAAGGRPKGKSTLTLYTAAQCTRDPVCKLRAGRSDLDIGCLTCLGQFHPQP